MAIRSVAGGLVDQSDTYTVPVDPSDHVRGWLSRASEAHQLELCVCEC